MSELRTRWTSCGALDTSDGFFFFFPTAHTAARLVPVSIHQAGHAG